MKLAYDPVRYSGGFSVVDVHRKGEFIGELSKWDAGLWFAPSSVVELATCGRIPKMVFSETLGGLKRNLNELATYPSN